MTSGYNCLVIGLARCRLGLSSNKYQLSNVFLRTYSQYPPHFVKPVYQPAQLDDILESGESKNLEFTPVRAAYVNHTSSIFHDKIVMKFTNHVMKTGRKSLARELVEKTFQEIKRIQLQKWNEAKTAEEKANTECNPLTIFHQAVENCRPVLQLIPIKRGGIRYQVPIPITDKRSYFISMRWFVHAGREKERKIHFPERLARELIAASNNEGRVVKQKQDLHRQCEANRAYAHYRWG
ncbi:hypothetical protein OTU49_006959 [Cherax quadricarinatus]|uniref:Small ribosomal subunit protein uS7 domain-containing protein n=1 Tax=Cherax quadricarinatus TaxID=27406 RepID=A0AAW0X0X4_CHEQU|nr:28S ribosomal protein S7, mitochondrial-like [Cherax quadricarinatus]